DILDQTPEGERIDKALTDVLSKEKLESGKAVVKATHELLDRFATPDKPHGGIEMPVVEVEVSN
ncbi:MAG: hypothetical protein AAGF10_03300, partial [Verrucomicrobiota bacterium]